MSQSPLETFCNPDVEKKQRPGFQKKNTPHLSHFFQYPSSCQAKPRGNAWFQRKIASTTSRESECLIDFVHTVPRARINNDKSYDKSHMSLLVCT